MHTSQLQNSPPPAELSFGKTPVGVEAEWLDWLRNIFPDVSGMLLFSVNPNQTISCCATSPASLAVIEPVTNAVLSCVHRQKPLYVTLDSSSHGLVVPLQGDENAAGFVLILVAQNLSEIQQNTAVQLTMWASSRLYSKSAQPTESTKPLGPEVQLTSSMVQSLNRHGSFKGLSFTLVNKLASLCGCVRVSLGHYDNEKLRLIAMSGQSKIDDRRKIARQLCALMHETLACRRGVYPSTDDALNPVFKTYFKNQGEHPLLSFVMPGNHEDQFVLVLERDGGNSFAEAQADAIENSVQNLAALLSVAFKLQMPQRKKLQRQLKNKVKALSELSKWSNRQIFAGAACAKGKRWLRKLLPKFLNA